MLRGDLPEKVDPLRLARAGGRLQGELALAGMKRLQEAVEAAPGNACVHLEFGVDEQGTPFVTGTVSARVVTRCQRCLEPMELALEAEVRLGVVMGEEAVRQLDRRYEPLLVEAGEPVSLAALVEEELLLALPFAPMHPPEVCPAQDMAGAEETEQAPQREENPFSALADWKHRNHD